MLLSSKGLYALGYYLKEKFNMSGKKVHSPPFQELDEKMDNTLVYKSIFQVIYQAKICRFQFVKSEYFLLLSVLCNWNGISFTFTLLM